MSLRPNLLRNVCGSELANLRDSYTFWIQRRKVQSGEPAVVPQCNKFRSEPPKNEAIKEHLEGTEERRELAEQLMGLLRYPITMPVVLGTEKLYSERFFNARCKSAHANEALLLPTMDADSIYVYPGCGGCYPLVIPFDHAVIGSYFFRPVDSVVARAVDCAVKEQPCWERLPIDQRCKIFDKAADIMAGEQRQRIIAAQMIGQAMTCIQAEHNLCQLIDYTRINSNFLRDLTTSRCVSKGGKGVTNLNHYHGLEGFFAAITPSDSLSNAAQLAITPAIMGNTVLWKPSDYSLLACYCVMECLVAAGLPPGVINFIPAEHEIFLNCICSRKELAGVAFGGTTPALQQIWQSIGNNIYRYNRLPKDRGSWLAVVTNVRAKTGYEKNSNLLNRRELTRRFLSIVWQKSQVRGDSWNYNIFKWQQHQMAGQKTTSCSRVYVHKKILTPFINLLIKHLKTLFVTHPLDHRCFMSSLISLEAYQRVVTCLVKSVNNSQAKLVFGGRACGHVGYFVEPSVFLVKDANHSLLREEIRGPILSVYTFDKIEDLVESVGRAPYALCGAVFAEDAGWACEAVTELRDLATMLVVNDRCSEECPAQQSLGGSRLSGIGSKAGSISYLLSYCSERSLREVTELTREVTYSYMREARTPQDKPSEKKSEVKETD